MKTLVAVVLVAGLSLPAAANECIPTTSEPEVDVDTGVGIFGTGRYYVDNDDCQPACIFSISLYEESNGIEGLQRGDVVKDDTCGGRIPADYPPFY